MISIRRKLMAKMQTGEIDTSPIIEYYDKGLANGGLNDVPGCCTTVMYEYPAQTFMQTYVGTGGWGANQGLLLIFENGTQIDWWGTSSQDNYERQCIDANSNGLKISLQMNRLDDAYMYLKETGQILFAGRNSIYYGHRNINELN